MKKLFFVFALLVSMNLFGQADALITYSEVVEVPSMKKDQLYANARLWFVNSFKSAKDVLQVQDKETGELVGKGWFEEQITIKMMGSWKYMAQYYFKMSVFVKDGKYKYTITDIDNTSIKGNDNSAFGLLYTSIDPKTRKWPMYSESKHRDIYLTIKEASNNRIKLLIDDLKKNMIAKSESDF